MRTFIEKISIICFSVFFFFIVLALIQENKISHLLFLESTHKTYFNPKKTKAISKFKLKHKGSDISILGTSRVSGFEQSMFENQSVYNYSMISNSFDDIYNIIHELELAQNDTIILGIDQWILNQKYPKRNINYYENSFFDFPLIFENYKTVDSVFLIGKASQTNFSGYRKDGSYFHGKRFIIEEKKRRDYNFKNTLSRIKNSTDRFEKGENIDLIQIKKLSRILEYCKSKQIEIVAFFPPFAPTIYNKMFIETNNYSYISKAKINLINLFDNYDFIFEDFTKIEGFNDNFFLDGFHCNRNIYYEILNKLGFKTNKSFDNSLNLSEQEKMFLTRNFR